MVQLRRKTLEYENALRQVPDAGWAEEGKHEQFVAQLPQNLSSIAQRTRLATAALMPAPKAGKAKAKQSGDGVNGVEDVSKEMLDELEVELGCLHTLQARATIVPTVP
eukprot:TRINITY_DN4346_c0_g1_i2.p2 TRINITY_DN4346_c0_g1~~TRINITY_DN4346_c0_g1_i2.p2  ORF type:complete len:108 (+),score=19.04 TRINITY_DN4346_c0_g1_i2:294-617(+)